jgi:hypothetical protein
MSMSMNNRLLQNYLDLSVNSEAKSSVSTPKSSKNKKNSSSSSSSSPASNKNKENLKKNENKNNNNCCDESITNEFLFKSKSLYPKKEIITEKTPNEELIDLKQINMTSESNENNEEIKLVKNYSEEYHEEDDEEEENDHYDKDNFDKKSSLEINRIPSIKRHKYSVSTIATQADMDKGSIMAERKDFKYRNQDHSDVESQILSIEVDLCSDVYASIADWYNLKNNNNPNLAVQNDKMNTYMDKFLSARKELASVTVNDYMAFQNCLNFQLQAAREAAVATAQSNKNEINNNKYKIEFINPEKDQINRKDLIKSSSNQQKPAKNRMVLRISSISSSRSSFMENKNTDQNKSSLVPFNYQTQFDASTRKLKKQPFFRLQSNKNSETPSIITKNADSTGDFTNILAYHAFGSSDSFQSNSNSSQNSSTLSSSQANQSFPNNLYMYLDSVPHLKSYLNMHDNEIAKQYIEKLFKLTNSNDILSKSSFFSAIGQKKNSDSTTEKSDESFNKCYEINKTKTYNNNKRNMFDEDDENEKIYENDPNMIYSQVESSSNDEQDVNKSPTDSSSSNSGTVSSSNSSNTTRSNSLTSSSTSIENAKEFDIKKQKQEEKEFLIANKSSNLISSSDEIIKKEMVSFNLDNNMSKSNNNCSSSDSSKESPTKTNFKTVNYLKELFNKKSALSSSSNLSQQNEKLNESNKISINDSSSLKTPTFTSTFNSSPTVISSLPRSEINKIDLSNLPRAERIKIMLEQERKALDLAKKVDPTFSSSQSTPSKSNESNTDFGSGCAGHLNKAFNKQEDNFNVNSNNNENGNSIDCESSSSNATSTKNVRFSDNVSYI